MKNQNKTNRPTSKAAKEVELTDKTSSIDQLADSRETNQSSREECSRRLADIALFANQINVAQADQTAVGQYQLPKDQPKDDGCGNLSNNLAA